MAKKSIYHTRLIARPAGGFLAGLASLVVLAGPRRKTMRPKSDAVAKSLRGDFVRIAMDMRKAAAEETSREKASR